MTWANPNGCCNGPVMMTGSTRAANRWEIQHGSAVLTAHEREEIRVGIEADESLSDIALRLGRAPSTVCREVDRKGGRHRYCATEA